MNILCICCLWESFRDVIYNGKNKPNGMTASYRVLKELKARGNKVDYIFYSYFNDDQGRTINIKADWIFENEIKDIVQIFYTKGIKKLIYYSIGGLKLRRAVQRVIKTKNYDFVYGQGPTSDIVADIFYKNHIPFATRRFGDQYYNMIKQKGLLYASLSYPFEYISFKAKKEFMLCTNDGSGLDKAYNLIWMNKNSPYKFYHMLNGVDKISGLQKTETNNSNPFLLYVARVTDWKRQDMAIELVYKLKKRGVFIDLLIAGQYDIQSEYYKHLIDLIKKYELTKQVKIIGVIDKERIYKLSSEAVACLSLYDICNLGNSLLEYMAAGGLVISRNDGSLDEIVKNNENGFLVNNIDEAVNIVEDLVSNTIVGETIKMRSKKMSDEKILSWDDRVDFEIKLIERTLTASQKDSK